MSIKKNPSRSIPLFYQKKRALHSLFVLTLVLTSFSPAIAMVGVGKESEQGRRNVASSSRSSSTSGTDTGSSSDTDQEFALRMAAADTRIARGQLSLSLGDIRASQEEVLVSTTKHREGRGVTSSVERNTMASAGSSSSASAPQSVFEDFSVRARDQEPMRIGLSIDGGGTGGLIPALELDEIENLSRKPICKLFDAGAGTSIGGILELGLFAPGEVDASGKRRPKHNANDFVNLFRTQSQKIFAQKYSNLQEVTYKVKKVSWKPRYFATSLEALLQEKFEGIPLSAALKPIILPAVPLNRNHSMNRKKKLYLFSSHTASQDPRHNFLMWQAGRGTSAAPTFFPDAEFVSPVEGVDPLRVVDGGVLWNNPSILLHDEMQHIYPHIRPDNYAIVSLGTGFNPETDLPQNSGTVHAVGPIIAEARAFIADQCDERMRERLDDRYMRLQVHFEEPRDLDDTTQEALDLFEFEAEKHLDRLEDITRFLLITHDKWEDRGGRDIYAPA